jgi:uncharacterized integral membrane protein
MGRPRLNGPIHKFAKPERVCYSGLVKKNLWIWVKLIFLTIFILLMVKVLGLSLTLLSGPSDGQVLVGVLLLLTDVMGSVIVVNMLRSWKRKI